MDERATRTGAGRAASAWLRAAVWALATFFVAGQLGSAAHFLAVQHGVCPEHGELVHLEPPTPAAHAAAAHLHGGLDQGASPGFERAPAPAKVTADEHCPAVAGARRDPCALEGRVARVDPPATPSALAPPRPEPTRPRGRAARLALAPKHSPPPRA